MRRFAQKVRRAVALAAVAIAAVAALAAPAPPPRVLVLDVSGAISGPITGATEEYLRAALARAKAEGFDAVAIQLDTPGGMLDATRDIVRALLGSEVPVLVWVGPA